MSSVLITGGAGFIGSHLVDRLLDKGYRVAVLDNMSTGSTANLAHLMDNPNMSIVVGSVTDRATLDPLVEQSDMVYHLAASVGVKHIMENLVASIRNNVDGTVAVLEAAAAFKKRTIITSTSEVYGKSHDAPSRETDDLRMGETIKSRWSYACSKALDEYLAFSYYHERGLPVTIVRLFNTVGERQTSAFGMVVPTFVRQAQAGEAITIHGDGSQKRCFAYVKDVVWALHRLAEHDAAIGDVYNIGTTEQVTIDQLADAVIRSTQSTSRKVYIPYDRAYKTGFEDAKSRMPDITKIENEIGFEPKHTLSDIISVVAKAHDTVHPSVVV